MLNLFLPCKPKNGKQRVCTVRHSKSKWTHSTRKATTKVYQIVCVLTTLLIVVGYISASADLRHTSKVAKSMAALYSTGQTKRPVRPAGRCSVWFRCMAVMRSGLASFSSPSRHTTSSMNTYHMSPCPTWRPLLLTKPLNALGISHQQIMCFHSNPLRLPVMCPSTADCHIA